LSAKQYEVTGKYFEDLNVGDEWVSPGRTLTETDLMVYCYLTGDYNPLHTDEEFCKTTRFGTRIFHGPCTTIMTSGLISRIGILEGTVYALLENNWRFKVPVKIGDTIRLVVTITDKRETKNPEAGLVVQARKVLNQRDEVVVEGETKTLIYKRPVAEPKK